MNRTSTSRPVAQLLRGAFAFSALWLLFIVFSLPSATAGLATHDFDSRDVIGAIVERLEAGRTSIEQKLTRLGFGDLVEEAQRGAGGAYSPHGFSGRTLIEYVYNRAEANQSGEGERFLALLRNDEAQRSAQIATDPKLSFLAHYSDAELAKTFDFKPVSPDFAKGAKKPLSPAVVEAIGVLSDHLADKGIGRAKHHFLRNFEKKGFNAETIDRILLSARSPQDAIQKFFEAGTPPPTAREASLKLLAEFSRGSSTFAIDPEVLRVAQRLNLEIPEEVERYQVHADGLQSRAVQEAEVTRASRDATKSSQRPSRDDVIAGMQRPPEGPSVPPAPGSDPLGGGRDGGGSKSPSSGGERFVAEQPGNSRTFSPSHRQAALRSYDSYVKRTFEPRSGSPGPSAPGSGAPVSRTYRVAIGSPRAARGVAAGAQVTSQVQGKPSEAYWLPFAKDERFGRLLVKISSDAADHENERVIASRLLFTDSVHSALSVLRDDFGQEAGLRDGEILVLMSMDPESPILESDYGEKLHRLEQTQSELQQLVPHLFAALFLTAEETERADQLVREAEALNKAIPRPIVIHPALHGRELAWSIARTDFWFNNLDELESEAMRINGGIPMPGGYKELIAGGEAQTWQFYERDAVITTQVAAGIESFVLQTDTGTRDARYSVSLFSTGDPAFSDWETDTIPGESEFYRVSGMEEAIQPMLDSLARYHPDFWRLNDFYESLSLLRWLERNDAQVTIVDIDGTEPNLPTPDRIDTDHVSPKVGRDPQG